MRRIIKLFPFIFAFIAFSSSCIDNEPEIEYFPNENIAFKYNVKGNYELDYLVGSGIMFKNTSAVAGVATWNFGDNTPTQTGDSFCMFIR